MDISAFKQFEEFLTRTAPYAELAGYRFRGLQDFPANMHGYLQAFARTVYNADGADPVREDLRRALAICEAEAIRKVMVVTCKELDLFPPPEDETSEIAGIAFALYTQQQALDLDQVVQARHKQLNMTAFFLADFAHFAGVPEAKETSNAGKRTLNDFLNKAKDRKPKDKWKLAVFKIIDEFFPSSVKKDVTTFFDSHGELVVLGTVFAAGVALAALLLGKRR
jgi:hypothetical protein